MTILWRKEGIQGVYRIGEMPSFGIEFEQYGTMVLSVKR